MSGANSGARLLHSGAENDSIYLDTNYFTQYVLCENNYWAIASYGSCIDRQVVVTS
jgi:hypothetical protein